MKVAAVRKDQFSRYRVSLTLEAGGVVQSEFSEHECTIL